MREKRTLSYLIPLHASDITHSNKMVINFETINESYNMKNLLLINIYIYIYRPLQFNYGIRSLRRMILLVVLCGNNAH